MRDDLIKTPLQLADVTMMEAVSALREQGFFIQFERERLDNQNADLSRPVIDSRRRFSVSLSLNQPVNHVLDALTRADGGYDWIQLTQTPASYWIFPHSEQGDRFASSSMVWKVGSVSTAGHPLSKLVSQELGLQDHQIQIFNRAKFLEQVTSAPEMKTAGRPLYEVLGELFARSGKKILWNLGGFGDQRVLSIGMLPPPRKLRSGR
jgi:hypothetical protein